MSSGSTAPPSPLRTSYRVSIRKEALKFSSAHMTVFPDGTKESLHGHNYRTEISLDLAEASLEKMLPFATLKRALRGICEQWDEKLLLAARCPFLSLRTEGVAADEIEFWLCGRHYVLPRAEVELLPVTNITTETLAAEACARLLTALGSTFAQDYGVRRLELRIDEITGQGVAFIVQFAEP